MKTPFSFLASPGWRPSSCWAVETNGIQAGSRVGWHHCQRRFTRRWPKRRPDTADRRRHGRRYTDGWWRGSHGSRRCCDWSGWRFVVDRRRQHGWRGTLLGWRGSYGARRCCDWGWPVIRHHQQEEAAWLEAHRHLEVRGFRVREVPRLAALTGRCRWSQRRVVGHIQQVDAGDDGFACGVRTDGTIACWGDNRYGQTTAPTGTFSEVSAGGPHACGVRTDGTIACWGFTIRPDQRTDRDILGGVGRRFHACGVRTDGTIACWGSNSSGQTNAPTGTFSEVSAGGSHACGVRTDGTIACWGSNSSGQTNAPTGHSRRCRQEAATLVGYRPTARSPAGALTLPARPTHRQGHFRRCRREVPCLWRAN